MTARKPLADQEYRHIAATDFDRSIAVEAAAGTGKTEALATRAVNAIAQGRATMERIAAITFTRKAAGELQVRIRRKLSEKLAEDIPEEQKDRVRQAIRDVEKAHLSTIHSFCERLLQEDPFPIHLDPGFRIMDDVESGMFFDRFCRKWLREQGNRKDSDLEKVLTTNILVPKDKGKSLEPVRITMDELLETAADMNKKGMVDLPRQNSYQLTPLDVMRRFISEMEAEFQKFDFRPGDVLDTGDKLYAGLVDIRSGLSRAAACEDWVSMTEELLSIKLPGKGKGSRANWKDSAKLDILKEMYRPFQDLYQQRIEESLDSACCIAYAPVLGKAVDLAFNLVEEYRARKKEEGLVDFHDLLLFSDQLLHDEEARKFLSGRFDLILVDECQDVDPLQLDIILRLSGEGDPDSDDYSCFPGRLFFVGDPKQSIFYFRGADLQAYKKARDKIMAGKDCIPFSQNFRSVGQLCTAVNHCFGPVMNGEGHQADYVELQPHRSKHTGPAIVRLQVPEENLGSTNLGDLRAAEANVIASFLVQLRDGTLPFQLNVTEKSGETRPAKLSDVLLLLHRFGQENFGSDSKLSTYEQALEEHQVPYVTIGGKEYFGRAEVRYAYSLFRSLVEPYDHMSVAATLRGPFAAVKDGDMLDWYLAGGRFVLREDIPEGTDIDHPVHQAILKLIELRKIALDTSLSIRNRVELILSRSGMLLTSACDRNGTGRVGNLFRMISLADTAEDAGIVTFSGYLRFLRNRIDDRTKAEELVLDPGNEMEAVRIMTVHKAKGLEEKVVILADWSRDVSNSIPSVLTSPDGTALISAGKVVPETWGTAIDEEKARQAAEFCRLGYVAATRARDWLVAVQFSEMDKIHEKIKGPLQPLSAVFSPSNTKKELKSLEVPLEVIDWEYTDVKAGSKPSSKGKVTPLDDHPVAHIAWRGWIENANLKGNDTLRIASAKSIEDGVFDLSDIEVTVSTPQIQDDTRLPMDDRSNRRGELVHELMQIADLEPLLSNHDLEDQVRQISEKLRPVAEGMVHCEGWEEKETDVLLAFTIRLLYTPIMRKVASAPLVRYEVPFSCIMKTTEGKDILVEGTADLIFKDRNSQWWVADYKTGITSEKRLEEKHGTQVALYAEALSKSIGCRTAVSLIGITSLKQSQVK